MSRFQRRKREVPGLNLASLPDLIFTVLFFFLLVTHMRDVNSKVRFEVPQGTELAKTPNKGGMVYIFIGKPVDEQGRVVSDETRIQLNDRYVSIDEIVPELNRVRSQMSESDRQHMVVSLRADRHTEMGIINDVKQALRQAGALNVNYSATGKNKENKK